MSGIFRKNQVPATYFQTQTTECGLGAMAMILGHFGRFVTLEELRQVSGVSRDCVNATDLVRIAKHYRLEARVLKREPDSLPELGFPLVVYLNFIHFVVVEGMTAESVLLNDPACGRFCMPNEEFDEAYTGITLSFSPGDAFETGGKKPALHAMAGHFLKDGKAKIVLAMISGLLLNLPLVFFAWQADELLSKSLGRVAFWLMIAAFMRGALVFFQKKLLSNLELRLSGEGASRLLDHLISLPHAFFVYRIPAVLQGRVHDQAECARLLCKTILPAFFNLPGMLFLLAALFHSGMREGTSASLTIIAFLLLISLLRHLGSGEFRRMRGQNEESWIKLSHAIGHFESFKTGSGDIEFLSDSMGGTSGIVKLRQMYGFFHALSEASPELLIAILLLFLPANASPAAFILAFALLPNLREISKLHGKLDLLQEKLSHLVDLNQQVQENPSKDDGPFSGAECVLEARNVEFGFSPVKPPLLREISFAVRRGEQVGITGPSGCGKSTLAQLLVGLHKPWKGEFFIEGLPASFCSRERLSKKIAWVNKHPFFFSGSLRENLCLWHEATSETALHDAIRDACLDEVIERLPEGLDSRVEHRAANFSGGQKQRMEIARALLLDPQIMVLDEATDGLDHALEQKLRSNLKKRGITLIVVSHRASTLAECDRVLRMAEGRLVEEIPERPRPPVISAFSSEEDPIPLQRPPGDRRESLFQCFELVASEIGEKSVTLPHEPLPTEGSRADEKGLSMLARYNRIPMRSVRFVVGKWWRRDHGPLIAFLKDGHRPVAILPSGAGYVIFDPEKGARIKLDLHSAKLLENRAYMLYSRHDSARKGPLRFFLHDFSRLAPDLFGAASSSLALACLYAFIPFRLLNADHGLHWGTAACLASAALVLAEAARISFLLRMEGRLELSASSAIFQRVMRLQPLHFGKHGPEEISSSIHSIPRILDLLGNGVLRRLFNIGVFLSGIAALAWISLKSAGFALLLLLPMLVTILPASIGNKWATRRLHLRIGNMRYLLEMLKAVPRLRQMDRQKQALNFWKAGREDEMKLSEKMENADLLADSFADFYPWLASVLFLVPVNGEPHEVVMLSAFLISAFSLQNFSLACSEIMKIMPMMERLNSLSSAPVEPKAMGSRHEAETVEIRNLGFTYPENREAAISGVSMTIAPGEFVALAGPSGSGKSTLLRLLLGFPPPP